MPTLRSTSLAAALFAVALAATPVLHAQQSFSSLEERMSSAEFKAAGLDKLTPEELKTLDEWLRTHGTGGTQLVTPGGKPVFYPSEAARKEEQGHLVGRFAGWTGGSVFTLDNGQVWKQAESGSYVCPERDNPAVTLKPMLLGSWLMYVEGCNQSVRVQRIR
ncbi:hypothetical protein MBSD_n1944 [Mizugakiibacter sediminis]|uniref:Secreted protein n=1 Tax=Mizugakiibacter sediminis TaxID=1475481 RepID=A0A0K8QP35_9GAMM|nr:hypothetical protein [Mizugakiibacter sediminis]GAP66633.1 hypothetical protein MBSD_n1944 [Mizugakiibacter sediminis]